MKPFGARPKGIMRVTSGGASGEREENERTEYFVRSLPINATEPPPPTPPPGVIVAAADAAPIHRTRRRRRRRAPKFQSQVSEGHLMRLLDGRTDGGCGISLLGSRYPHSRNCDYYLVAEFAVIQASKLQARSINSGAVSGFDDDNAQPSSPRRSLSQE